MNAMTEYKAYSIEDKAALQALRAEAATKLGVALDGIKLADLISAVTPGLETPEYLKGI